MEQHLQHTVHHPVRCSGIALHTGATVTITIKPAACDTGIVFQRTDVDGVNPYVPAHYRNVVDTKLGTTIANVEGTRVGTIEHLMAALWGCGVDNAMIEIDGPEVPIMDGSSEPFVFLVECAGLVTQEKPRKYVRVLKEITVRDGDATATLSPHAGFAVDVEIDFPNQVVARQRTRVDFSDASFKNALSRARTFGFEHEVSMLRSIGLAKGGSLENAIVVGADRIINEDGLRYADEFARHKVLDCVGDLFLAGARILGQFNGYKSGHCVNNKILRELFADKSAWSLSLLHEPVSTPVALHAPLQ